MDCILTAARRLDGTVVDIEIRDGLIDAISEHGDGDVEAFDSDQQYDVDERLVTPSFTEPHIHLDTALTAGDPAWNSSGSIAEGIDIWGERKQSLTADDVRKRAVQAITWLVAHGVTRVRTHVDTTEPSLTAIDVLSSLRSELSDLVDIQLIAFPQDGLFTAESHEGLLRNAADNVDAIGAIPHYERTREEGVKSVKTVAELAQRYDCDLDLHIDEIDDPQSRFTEVLAAEAQQRGLGDRTTASHVTAIHSYPNAYAKKLVSLLADTGVSVVTNPSANAVLQGRHDDYPRRRGHTRIDSLREAGVTVGIGQDSLMDPWYHFGTGDPLEEAFVLLHAAHMNGYDDVSTLWEMLLDANAEIFGVDEYGLTEGTEGSLIVFDSTDPFSTLRTRADRLLVIKNGRVTAWTEDGETTVVRDGDETPVDFRR